MKNDSGYSNRSTDPRRGARGGSFIDMELTGIYKVNEHLTTSISIANLMDRLPPIDPVNYAG